MKTYTCNVSLRDGESYVPKKELDVWRGTGESVPVYMIYTNNKVHVISRQFIDFFLQQKH